MKVNKYLFLFLVMMVIGLFIFSTAQGPVLRIVLFDTNQSHYMEQIWNENEASANRLLNWELNGANRAIKLSGDLELTGDNRFDIITFTAEHNNGNCTGATTFDFNNGQKQKATLTGNITVTFTPPTTGVGNFLLRVIQDGTGGRDIDWGTVQAPDEDSDDDGDLNPDTDANTVCIYSIYYNGTSYYIILANDFHTWIAD